MKKRLRLISFISFIMYLGVSAIAADTLSTNKNNVYIGLRYGLPALNQLTIYSSITLNGFYNVRSKSKNCYEFFITDNYKKYNYSLGLTLIHSEFEGREFKIYNYDLYQKINYNLYYGSIGFGRNFKLGKRHLIAPSIHLYFPLVYDIKINNIYSKNNSKDTTLIPATKNGFNYDTNFGHFPSLKIGVSYGYEILERLQINVDLSALYSRTFGGKTPESLRPSTALGNSNNYSFLAYKVGQQFIILPTIGITFKLTK